MEEVINGIVAIDRRISYVGIIDNNGNIIKEKTPAGAKPLLSSDERKVFAKEVSLRRSSREKWDKILGKVLCAITARDSATVSTFYWEDKIVLLELARGVPLSMIDAVRTLLGLT